MSWFFAIVMVLAHFNPLLPKIDEYQNQPKATLVYEYSRACLALFQRDELKGLDLTQIMAQLAQTNFQLSKPGEQPNVTDKISAPALIDLYKKICKPNPDLSALDQYDTELKTARSSYDDIMKDLPEIGEFESLKYSQAIDVLSADGTVVNEIYKPGDRRKWVSITDLPAVIPKSFVAVEDHRFFEHHGVDEIGILRAFFKALTSKRRPEGASTITQQVARDLYLDKTVSMSRKLREIVLAERLEQKYDKKTILEIYLNRIYFGRNSWGVEKAAETYFGKAAKDLTVVQIAYLVGIVKGPNQYQFKDGRTVDRVNVVLQKMAEEKLIAAVPKVDFEKDLRFAPFDLGHAAYFRDFVSDQLGAAGVRDALIRSASVHTTLNEKMQTLAENSLREGLVSYEHNFKRDAWRGPLTNVFASIKKLNDLNTAQKAMNDLEEEKDAHSLYALTNQNSQKIPDANANGDSADANDPIWLAPLRQVALRYAPPISTWFVAVATNDGYMGTADGRKLKISSASAKWAKGLNVGDVVFVRKVKGQAVEIVQSPIVNGAVIALDPMTGNILAMVGGYNYQTSQYNRALTKRQPGSLMKPFTYMAGLQLGYQPNYLLQDGPFIFPPSARGGEEWIPHNYENTHISPHPLMWAIENSRNCMTADLMSKTGIEPIRQLAKEFGVYENPDTNYPFILGTQETTLLTMARAYSAIDTGALPQINFIQTSNFQASIRKPIEGVDSITLFQLRFLMQGVIERGTAVQLHDLSPYLAGKTGTTEDEHDAWFMTFTPHLVVGIYVGYDQPINLGKGASGATVALPIAEKIIRESFNFYHPQEAFVGPPGGVSMLNTDKLTGDIRPLADPNTVVEPYRIKP